MNVSEFLPRWMQAGLPDAMTKVTDSIRLKNHKYTETDSKKNTILIKEKAYYSILFCPLQFTTKTPLFHPYRLTKITNSLL